MTISGLVGWGKQDIAGKATMTITLNWTVTLPDKSETFVLERTRRIVIVAPSYCKFELQTVCYILRDTGCICSLHLNVCKASAGLSQSVRDKTALL